MSDFHEMKEVEGKFNSILPERHLLCATISGSIESIKRMAVHKLPRYHSSSDKGRGIVRDSAYKEVRWIMDESDGDAFSNLKNSCEAIGMSYDAVKTKIMPYVIKVNRIFNLKGGKNERKQSNLSR